MIHDLTTEKGSTEAILDLLNTPIDKPNLELGHRLDHLCNRPAGELSTGEQIIVKLALEVWTGQTDGILFRLGYINRSAAAHVLHVLAARLGIEQEVGVLCLRPGGDQ